jgi:hypothetical protein
MQNAFEKIVSRTLVDVKTFWSRTISVFPTDLAPLLSDVQVADLAEADTTRIPEISN